MLSHLRADYHTTPTAAPALRQAMQIYLTDLLAAARAHARLQVSITTSHFQAINNLT